MRNGDTFDVMSSGSVHERLLCSQAILFDGDDGNFFHGNDGGDSDFGGDRAKLWYARHAADLEGIRVKS